VCVCCSLLSETTNHKLDPDACLLRIDHRTDASRDVNRNLAAELKQAPRPRAPNITTMANRGYDVVVDVDQEVCIHSAISDATRDY
jgi:hypothetical protein